MNELRVATRKRRLEEMVEVVKKFGAREKDVTFKVILSKDVAGEAIEFCKSQAADMIIKGKFAHYTGEALKREEVSSIRVNPKEEEGQS